MQALITPIRDALLNHGRAVPNMGKPNTGVVDRLGPVDHRANWDSWGSCPSGRFLEDTPYRVVAVVARTGPEDDPRRTGNQ